MCHLLKKAGNYWRKTLAVFSRQCYYIYEALLAETVANGQSMDAKEAIPIIKWIIRVTIVVLSTLFFAFDIGISTAHFYGIDIVLVCATDYNKLSGYLLPVVLSPIYN